MARCRLGHGALVKFVLLDDEDLLDQIGMIEKQAALAEMTRELNDVAVFAGGTGEKVEAVLAKLESDAEKRLSTRAWRAICGGRHFGAPRYCVAANFLFTLA